MEEREKLKKLLKLKDNLSQTISLERKNDYWLKTIMFNTDTRFDIDSYQEFYSGVNFLPELYEAKYSENYLEMKIEHIEGTQLPFLFMLPNNVRMMDKAMRTLAHEVVPAFLKFSTPQKSYFHYDLKFSNMIMRNNKLVLIDIDSICWMDKTCFEDMEKLYYKEEDDFNL